LASGWPRKNGAPPISRPITEPRFHSSVAPRARWYQADAAGASGTASITEMAVTSRMIRARGPALSQIRGLPGLAERRAAREGTCGLLFCLSLFPFTTGWVEESRFAQTPVTVYGLNLLAAGLAYVVLQTIIIRQQGPGSPLREAVGSDAKGKVYSSGSSDIGAGVAE
jgi:hypothetical protein